jgi:hypothetical protein
MSSISSRLRLLSAHRPESSSKAMISGRTITRPSQWGPKKEITFLWKPDDVLAELIYKPDLDKLLFIQRVPDGRTADITVIGGCKPLGWIKSYARQGAIRLPSGIREYGSFDELVRRCRCHIHTYFECDPKFESVAALFALHTWIYERFHAVPYLRFCGLPQTGKTRGIEVISSLCYHAHSISGSITTAPMFRTIEASGGTTIIDEADFRDSDVGSDVMKILNCGYSKGQPVSRVEKDKGGQFVPCLYEVFGPKIIGGRKATESRCLSYTPLPNRRELPLQVPDEFGADAAALQNQLLQWRLNTIEIVPLNTEYVPTVSRRMNQIIQPLLTVADLMSADERDRYRADLLEFAQGADIRARDVSSESVEAAIVRVLVDCIQRREALTCKALAEKVLEAERANIAGLDRWLSANQVSRMVREMGLETRHTRDGAVVVANEERLRALTTRFAIVTESSPKASPVAARL